MINAYPEVISKAYLKISDSAGSGEKHKALLDFSEIFCAYLVGLLLGEYKNGAEIVEKIETQLYIHKKAKLSFGIYVSYLRELSKTLSGSLISAKFDNNVNYEKAAELKLNYEVFKKALKEEGAEKCFAELDGALKGRNPSKTNLVTVFDTLTQIRNRFAHAADYDWPLGEQYYAFINPLLINTIDQLITEFELLRPVKLVRLVEHKKNDGLASFKNLESTAEDIVEIAIPDDWKEKLQEGKHYSLDENDTLMMRFYMNELPLPDLAVAEKMESEERYKLVEPILLPAIEEKLADDFMIDRQEYEQLLQIARNGEIAEEKLKELIYKVASEKGIEGDPLLMEKAVVLNLVEKFSAGETHYTSKDYNETQLRTEFLDKLFEALEWDVTNRAGMNEVKLEQNVKTQTGRNTKVDYAFFIANREKFFMEAKDATVNLAKDLKPALQLRRYSWNKGLPVGVVSNFREFAIYDCRLQPDDEKDTVETGRIFYCDYEQLAEKWEEIRQLISRQAVLDGSLEAFADKSKKTLQTVDKAFLEDMEKWRELLAENFVASNPELIDDIDGLNFAVQLTIDRLVFLRIAEDRESEPEEQLLKLADEPDVYAALVKLYYYADDKYNSGLFHFKEDRSRDEIHDEFTTALKLSNECVSQILDSLYSRPYDFSALPPEILGQAYEQFLGKVITVKGDKIVIEEKPEVKKAGGVFYTPAYIVDYIVENTIGKALEGKAPKDIAEFTILDPACGSGSFLIRAYQFMMDWYLDWYINNDPEKYAKTTKSKSTAVYKGNEGDDDWRLTTDEKKRILLAHIYGVDIDDKAVEVTKLSLQLKVIEGKLNEDPQLQLIGDRILPDLRTNIKCGNALIGPDLFDLEGASDLNRLERRKFRVFDWNEEYKEILERGGFDVILGNPPYLNIDDTWGKNDIRLNYIKEKFNTVYNDKSDILFYFIAQGLLIGKGRLAFIVSRAFLQAYKADKLRNFIINHTKIEDILDFRNFYVFKGVGIATAIIFSDKQKAETDVNFYELKGDLPGYINQEVLVDEFTYNIVPAEKLKNNTWSFADKVLSNIFEKVDIHPLLNEFLHLGQGMQTGSNSAFGKLDIEKVRMLELEEGQYFKRARNSDIERYSIKESGEYLLYPEAFEKFEDLPSCVQSHLLEHEEALKARAAFKRGNCEWWKYTWPLHKDYYDSRKRIYCPYLAKTNRFAIDESGEFLGLTDTTVLFDSEQDEDIYYILGLLNSRLLTLRYKYIGKLKGNDILEYFWNGISKISIRKIDFSNSQDKEQHNLLVSLVKQIISFVREKNSVRSPNEIREIERDIRMVDKKINNLVYDLYELNDEEKAIVDGSQ